MLLDLSFIPLRVRLIFILFGSTKREDQVKDSNTKHGGGMAPVVPGPDFGPSYGRSDVRCFDGVHFSSIVRRGIVGCVRRN